jgi:hypothetical protein
MVNQASAQGEINNATSEYTAHEFSQDHSFARLRGTAKFPLMNAAVTAKAIPTQVFTRHL